MTLLITLSLPSTPDTLDLCRDLRSAILQTLHSFTLCKGELTMMRVVEDGEGVENGC